MKIVRRNRSYKEGKTKDKWDIIRIISTAVASILIPLVIFFVGKAIEISIKESEVRLKMIELSVDILKTYPDTVHSDNSLRKWAISIIDEYSKVKLPNEAKVELEKRPIITSNEYREIFNKLQNEILSLKSKFEEINISDFNKPSTKSVFQDISNKAIILIEKLRQIPDTELSLAYNIVKYDHMLFLLAIVSECEINKNLRSLYQEEFIKQLVSQGVQIKGKVEKLLIAAENLRLSKWLVENETKNRIHFFLTWLWINEARLDDKLSGVEKIKIAKEEAKIDSLYLNKYKFNNPGYRWYLSKIQ